MVARFRVARLVVRLAACVVVRRLAVVRRPDAFFRVDEEREVLLFAGIPSLLVGVMAYPDRGRPVMSGPLPLLRFASLSLHRP